MYRDTKTFERIGAAMEVHRELGSGFLEAACQEVLESNKTKEDELVKTFFHTEARPKVGASKREHEENLLTLKGFSLCAFVALCETSLFTTSSKIGLLLNFGSGKLEYKRFIL